MTYLVSAIFPKYNGGSCSGFALIPAEDWKGFVRDFESEFSAMKHIARSFDGEEHHFLTLEEFMSHFHLHPMSDSSAEEFVLNYGSSAHGPMELFLYDPCLWNYNLYC